MTEAKNLRNQTVTRVYPAVFITASLGGLSFLAFSNGLLLAYFSRLEISSSEILLLLALPSILQFMLVLVFGLVLTVAWQGAGQQTAAQEAGTADTEDGDDEAAESTGEDSGSGSRAKPSLFGMAFSGDLFGVCTRSVQGAFGIRSGSVDVVDVVHHVEPLR